MTRVQAMVQLSTSLIEALDEEAARKGISRSALIRDVIEAHLGESVHRAIGRRIVEGYERIPPGTPDTWGDLSNMGDASAGELLQRLDDEESKQGFGPW